MFKVNIRLLKPIHDIGGIFRESVENQCYLISGSVKLYIGDSWSEPETQTLGGGVGNLKFFRTMHIYKWQPFFDFFIMADTDIPFLLTLGKPETQTLWGLVI